MIHVHRSVLAVLILAALSLSPAPAANPLPSTAPEFRPAVQTVSPLAPPAVQSAGATAAVQIVGNLRILTLDGTPYEMGLAHGRALRKEIREIVGLWQKDLEETTKTGAAAFIKEFLARTNFTASIRKWTPGLLDEVRGIADGAGLDFETIYAYQLIDESWVVGPDLARSKCTSIGSQKRGGNPAFVSQTLDIPRFYHGCQTVLRVRDRAAGVEALVLTIPGVIAANGLNNHGVGVCVNAVTQLAYSSDGLPVDFIVRGILARKSFAEAERFLRTIKAAAPQNYILGGPERVICLEVAGNKVAPFVPFDGAEFVYHTNHPLTNDDFNPRFLERLKARGRTLTQMKESCPRFNFLRQALKDNTAILDLDTLKDLYRDKASGINNERTYACTVMILKDKPELHISPGRPDAEPFQVLGY